MANIILNGKTVVTQTGNDEPLIGGNVVFPAGHVIQVKPFNSTAGTDSLTTSEIAIAASKSNITIKTNNPLIIYVCYLSYESDLNSSSNMFFSLKYSTDDSSYNYINSDKRMLGNSVGDAQGSGSVTFTQYHYLTANENDTIYYQTYFQKSITPSIYFNQPSLTGQPTNTDNMCMGYIMEIQQ